MSHKNQLEKLRVKHGSWSALAAVLGVTPRTVLNWRKWDAIPDRAAKQIAAMCETLPLEESNG